VDATDRKKDTHGCPFVASSSASHSRLQRDRGVHKWNLTQQFITVSHFIFHLYLYVRCDERLTVAWHVKPCSLVEMYRGFREICYRVIKTSLCTWWLQYRKLQVMLKVSPASLQTSINTSNCVLEHRVQYSTVHIPNVFCHGHLQIINCVYCNCQVHREFLITLYFCYWPRNVVCNQYCATRCHIT
jgi:hypothetical protein